MPALESVPKKRLDVMTRVFPEALDAARIACAYRGLSLLEYVSQSLQQVAERDIEEGHARRSQGQRKGGK